MMTAKGKRLGISPIISAVILIVVIFSIAAVVSPWMLGLVTDTTNQTGTDVDQGIKCREASYDFDTNYGTFGLSWNFKTENNTLGARIKNTGTIKLYNFSFELIINDTIIEYFLATDQTQRTSINPMKPGHTTFLNASITKDVNDTLTSVKILNPVCPDVYAKQDL
jgi:hypothetical protein